MMTILHSATLLQAGVALHYTPNYDWMIGVEMDAGYTEKNQDRGIKPVIPAARHQSGVRLRLPVFSMPGR